MEEPLTALETEGRNQRTRGLDLLPTQELLAVLHAENYGVAAAVEQTLPQLARVVDDLTQRMLRGGRLFYVGAGTSGRLGVLDASECPPTFGVAQDLVQGVLAGGVPALTRSIEGAEDDYEAGVRDLRARGVGPDDMVVGVAASGRTPYVAGALDAARAAGAATIALVNVSQAALARHAEITLAAITGPEALTGSTRLKAGTAQKLILNLLTTGVMVRLGKVYDNLMVDVQATNTKLRDRAVRIVTDATGQTRMEAQDALERADWHVKTAIVMLQSGVTAADAAVRLERAGGSVRAALEAPPP